MIIQMCQCASANVGNVWHKVKIANEWCVAYTCCYGSLVVPAAEQQQDMDQEVSLFLV